MKRNCFICPASPSICYKSLIICLPKLTIIYTQRHIHPLPPGDPFHHAPHSLASCALMVTLLLMVDCSVAVVNHCV